MDNDCDGEVDEGTLLTFFMDADGDGFGDPATELTACQAPAGFVSTGGDCDDGDPAVNPGAAKNCNGQDNDCDGQVDITCGGSTCAAATPIEEGAVIGDNSTEDDTPGLPVLCQLLTKDVWFTYTNDQPCDQKVTVSLCPEDGGSASFDSVIAVFEGGCGALVPIACDDDTCGSASRVEFVAEPGETYFIAVGSAAGTPGGPYQLAFDVTTALIEQVGTGCPDPALELNGTEPLLSQVLQLDVSNAKPSSFGVLLFGALATEPFPTLPPLGCEVVLDLSLFGFLGTFLTDGSGTGSLSVLLPSDPSLVCIELGLQAVVAAEVAGGLTFTNGLKLQIGE